MKSKAHGSIHEGFDTFLDASIKDGELKTDMNNFELTEALKDLGIHRKKLIIDESVYISNVYPSPKQLKYVRKFLNSKVLKQEHIEVIGLPYKMKSGRGRVKKGTSVYYKNRTYKGGQYLPKGYLVTMGEK